tara:strand:- start:1782 stop:2000 length:219 start_codon:yes stop_codon:yes gene_type:complete
MLILTRKIGQKIVLTMRQQDGPEKTEEITITVLETQINQASIGIDANYEVVINREEIHNKILNKDIGGKSRE